MSFYVWASFEAFFIFVIVVILLGFTHAPTKTYLYSTEANRIHIIRWAKIKRKPTLSLLSLSRVVCYTIGFGESHQITGTKMSWKNWSVKYKQTNKYETTMRIYRKKTHARKYASPTIRLCVCICWISLTTLANWDDKQQHPSKQSLSFESDENIIKI